MQKKQLIILTTGGTIEKSFSEFDGSLKNRESRLRHQLLSKLRLPHTDVELIEVMAKDSLEMTDSDRQVIGETVSRHLTPKCPILILHGTDTMEMTAKYLSKLLPAVPSPIILTGAMKPMGFEDSDAFQNLVEAMMACFVAEPGIYVSFHNHLFVASNVRKNRKRRTFETSED